MVYKSGVAGKGRYDLSYSARRRSALYGGVATSAVLRAKKIKRLRGVIESGKYIVDAPKTAEKMIEAALRKALGVKGR